MIDSKRKGEGPEHARFRRARPGLSLIFFLPVIFLAALFSGSCSRGAEQSLDRAAEAWDSKDYRAAVEEYEHYLYLNPDGDKSADARFQLANIYFLNLHRSDQAITHYRQFLDQNPNSKNAAVARERMAEAFAELGRSYEAIAELEALTPHDQHERRRIRLRIADLYFDQKNYSQALTEYAKVTEQASYDELSEQAYLREASIYHISRGQYQQAISAYQKLAFNSNDADVRRRALYGISDCHAGLFQFDEAINILREIKDEGEQRYILKRVSELEQQRREAARARNEVKLP